MTDLESLRADLDKAESSISEMLTELENRYNGTLRIDLDQIRHFDGKRRTFVRLSIEIGQGV